MNRLMETQRQDPTRDASYIAPWETSSSTKRKPSLYEADTHQPNRVHMKADVTRHSPTDNPSHYLGHSSVASTLTPGINSGEHRNFYFDSRLSFSSMYHPHSITPSPSSSKMLIDNYDTPSPTVLARDSIFMKKALKSTTNPKKRRESLTEPRPKSILPRRTKSSILPQPPSNQLKRRHYSLQPPKHDTPAVHWDPHIDAFEILRAKITGITRSMQEFHVQELFQDEKRKKKKLTTTTSSPLITSKNNRRLSLTSSHSLNTFREDPTRLSFIGHRRIRSQSCVPLSHDDSDDEDMLNIPSPNLTALYLTTNNLIHSRLDELSETASIKSTQDDDVSSMLEWQKKFLNLVTSCIHQSEELESLSTDVLNTEHRVRELMIINDTIHEQFQEREKQYEERIRECQDVAHQQLMMIDSLEELTADINMKMESRRREYHRQQALLALDPNPNEEENRWSFQKSVSDLLNMDQKHDLIQKMRWDIGMFVGGGVGTGHIIHSYEDKLNGIDMMIAGTGTTSTAIPRSYSPIDDDEYNTDDDYTSQAEFYSVSPSIGHIKLYQHQYILHLNNRDRRTRFAMLPKCLWIPDSETNQCQFQTHSHKRCPTQFSFFQRKHHCRKCGYILCQKHSANRLPLFSSSKIYSTTGQWSRVCDTCFHDLIMQK